MKIIARGLHPPTANIIDLLMTEHSATTVLQETAQVSNFLEGKVDHLESDRYFNNPINDSK